VSAAPPPAVDLIVLDWDGGKDLIDCLHSIDVQTLRPERVIVVDNGSRQPVYQRLPKDILRIPLTIIRNDTNLGFTGGINRAMKEVTAPYVAWVNNDAVLAEKWLEKLLAAVAGEGKIAGAQSVILRDKMIVDGAGITIDDGTFRQIGAGQTLASLKQVTQPWGISATAALYRTHALREAAIKGDILRPDLFAYYEDVELCARLRARGWRFKIVPEALVMHKGSASAGRLGRAGVRMRVRNRYIVARAHRGTGQIPALVVEDLSYSVKHLIHGQLQFALTQIGAMIDGVRGR
jgi:GT2 family glycosyltransferase